MANARSSALQPVIDDLQRIFTDRLEAVVVYGARTQGPVPCLALVRSLALEDLQQCAKRVGGWHREGAATPLLLTRTEFERSLDAFPIEYGEILQTHEVVVGSDPFAGLAIDPADLRRACEVQVKSLLLHLREDYLEGGGRQGEVAALVRDSAPAVAALLRHLARLDGQPAGSTADLLQYASDRIHLDPNVIGDLLALGEADDMPSVDPVKIFPAYLAAMQRLAEFVDRWHQA